MSPVLEYALKIAQVENQETIQQILTQATEEICQSEVIFIFDNLEKIEGLKQERDYFFTEEKGVKKYYFSLKTINNCWMCIENSHSYLSKVAIEKIVFLSKSARVALSKLEEIENLKGQIQLKNQQLLESKARFYNLSQISPVGIFRTDLYGQCNYVNEKIVSLTGLSIEQLLEKGWLEGINLRERQQAYREWRSFIKDNQQGKIYKYKREYEFIGNEGYSLWGKVEVIPQMDNAGKMVGFIGTISDVTESKQLEAERKRAQLLLNLQNQILEKIAKGWQLNNLLDEIVRAIESQVEGSMCSILLLDKNDRLRHGAAPSLPRGYIDAVDGVKIGLNVGSCGTAAYLGELVISPDLFTDEKWVNYREITSKYELRSCWSSPIFSSQGQVLGTFGIYYTTVKTPRLGDIEFLRTTANFAGIAIEKQRATTALHRSNTQLKLTLDATKIGTWSWNPLTNEHEWDDNLSSILNIEKELPNKYNIWLNKIHPEDLAQVKKAINSALKNNTSFTIEYRYNLTEEKQVWLLNKGNVIFNEFNQFEEFLGVIFDITEQKNPKKNSRKLMKI